MTKFSDLTGTFKISRLLKDKMASSKEAKETLNELSVLANVYAITVLSELHKDCEVTEDDVKKVFDSLRPRCLDSHKCARGNEESL